MTWSVPVTGKERQTHTVSATTLAANAATASHMRENLMSDEKEFQTSKDLLKTILEKLEQIQQEQQEFREEVLEKFANLSLDDDGFERFNEDNDN